MASQLSARERVHLSGLSLPDRASFLLHLDPDLSLMQVVTDSLGFTPKPVDWTVGALVWHKDMDQMRPRMTIVSNMLGILANVSDPVHGHHQWILFHDLQLNSPSKRKHQSHEILSGGWLNKWVERWVQQQSVINPKDFKLVHSAHGPCRLNVPTRAVPTETDEFYSIDRLAALRPDEAVRYNHAGKMQQGVVQGHADGCVLILPRFGGAYHAHRIPYDEAVVQAHKSSQHRSKRHQEKSQNRSRKRPRSLPPVSLPSIRQIALLNEPGLEGRSATYKDILEKVFARVSPDAAGMAACCCWAFRLTTSVLHPLRADGTRFDVDKASSPERMSWALNCDYKNRRTMMWAAAATGRMDTLVVAHELGLPVTEPVDPVYDVWHCDEHDHATGHACMWHEREPNGPQEPTATWWTAGIREGFPEVVQYAESLGYRFGRADRQALTLCQDGDTLALARRLTGKYYLDPDGREMLLAAQRGRDDVLKIWESVPHRFDSETLAACIRGGIKWPIERCIATHRTECIGQAAATAGDMDLMRRAIQSGWPVNDCVSCAARNGHERIIDLLLAEPKIPFGSAALEHAARGGYLEILTKLITSSQRDPDFDHDPMSLEIAAVEGGDPRVWAAIQPQGDVKDHVAYAAARVGNLDLVQTFVYKCASQFQLEKLLQYAAMGGHWVIVDHIMRSKCFRGDLPDSCWLAASGNGHLGLMQQMHLAYPLVCSKSQAELANSIIRSAARVNDQQMIRWMKSLGFESERARSTGVEYGYVPDQLHVHPVTQERFGTRN